MELLICVGAGNQLAKSTINRRHALFFACFSFFGGSFLVNGLIALVTVELFGNLVASGI